MATRGVVAMMGAGVAIVTVVAVMVRPGERAAAPIAAESRSAQQLGVRADGVDPAVVRREADDEEAREIALPGTRLAAEGEPPGRGEPPPPPAPPIPPSAGAMAESEAILAVQPKVLAAVEEALADQRLAIRRRCWNGNVPASASFPVEASYGADGTMLALNIGDSRDAPTIGGCVREQPGLVPPKIDAPGVGVTVKSSLTLP